MAPIKESLLNQVAPTASRTNNKVTVVGIGQVGMACAFSILTQVSVAMSPYCITFLFHFMRSRFVAECFRWNCIDWCGRR